MNRAVKLPSLPRHLSQHPVVALEDREELHGDDRAGADAILHHRFVGHGAARQPLEVAQAALNGIFPETRRRRIRDNEPEAVPCVEQPVRAEPRGPRRSPSEIGPAQCLHGTVRRTSPLRPLRPCQFSPVRERGSAPAGLAAGTGTAGIAR